MLNRSIFFRFENVGYLENEHFLKPVLNNLPEVGTTRAQTGELVSLNSRESNSMNQRVGTPSNIARII